MRRCAAVGIDDDLASGKPCVAVRTADFETAGRIDEVSGVHEHVLGEHRFDDLLDHRVGKLLLLAVHVGVVLRRENHRVDALRAPIDIANGHLRFRVGAQP